MKAPGFEKSLQISGATPAYEPMYDFHPAEGRFLTGEDLSRSAKVVVLGSTRRHELFGGRPAVGRVVSIGSDRYTVVGVMERKVFYWNSANRNSLEWMNEMVFVPITSMLTRMVGDRQNQKVAYINVQARSVEQMDEATEETKTILRRAHGGVEDFEVFNRAAFAQQMDEQGKIYDLKRFDPHRLYGAAEREGLVKKLNAERVDYLERFPKLDSRIRQAILDTHRL